MTRSVRVGVAQFAAAGDAPTNRSAAVDMVRKAAADGAELVLLHELVSTEYFPAFPVDDRYFELAEALDGPTVRALCSAAAEHGTAVAVPFFERVGPGRHFNTVALVDHTGTVVGVSRKTHIPRVQVPAESSGDTMIPVDEKYYFEPGPVPYRCQTVAGVGVGTLICHDRHFPEVARCLALAGAELLLIPATSRGIPGAGAVLDVWLTELRATAIQNMAFVAATNRVGLEQGQRFLGASGVFAPDGTVLTVCGDTDEVAVVDVPVGEIDALRNARGFFRDRRPELYGALSREHLPGENTS